MTNIQIKNISHYELGHVNGIRIRVQWREGSTPGNVFVTLAGDDIDIVTFYPEDRHEGRTRVYNAIEANIIAYMFENIIDEKYISMVLNFSTEDISHEN